MTRRDPALLTDGDLVRRVAALVHDETVGVDLPGGPWAAAPRPAGGDAAASSTEVANGRGSAACSTTKGSGEADGGGAAFARAWLSCGNLLDVVPVVGGTAKQLLLGGEAYSSRTLPTKFSLFSSLRSALTTETLRDASGTQVAKTWYVRPDSTSVEVHVAFPPVA